MSRLLLKTFSLLQSSAFVVALEVVVFTVLGHSFKVCVRVQQVLPSLRDLGGDQRVQVGRHVCGFSVLLRLLLTGLAAPPCLGRC